MAIDNLFECPLPAALPTIPNMDCAVESGSIIAIAVQQVQSTPSFSGTGATDIKLLATWTPLIAASTASAIRIIPTVNVTITPGEAITSGGNDNTTYGGVPKLLHGGYATFAGTLEGYSPTMAKAVREITAFSKIVGGRTKLRFFLLFDTNLIGHFDDYNGIEAFGFFTGDLNKAGEPRALDNYPIQSFFRYGWSDRLVYSKAAFDVSTLKNA